MSFSLQLKLIFCAMGEKETRGVSTTASIICSFISEASHYGPGHVLNMGHTNCIQYILFPEEFKVWKFLTFFEVSQMVFSAIQFLSGGHLGCFQLLLLQTILND